LCDVDVSDEFAVTAAEILDERVPGDRFELSRRYDWLPVEYADQLRLLQRADRRGRRGIISPINGRQFDTTTSSAFPTMLR
jgi:hypothetical protein